MKNFKLLLATTAILSTGALLANAGNLSATVNAYANILSPIEITEVTPIRFGNIVSSSGTIIIGRDGSVSGTANTISSERTDDTSPDVLGINPGVIKVSGNGLSDVAGMSIAQTRYFAVDITDITLKDNSDTLDVVTCGVASNMSIDGYNPDTAVYGNEMNITYGGTFTIDSGVAAKVNTKGMLNCHGTGTVTLIIRGANTG